MSMPNNPGSHDFTEREYKCGYNLIGLLFLLAMVIFMGLGLFAFYDAQRPVSIGFFACAVGELVFASLLCNALAIHNVKKYQKRIGLLGTCLTIPRALWFFSNEEVRIQYKDIRCIHHNYARRAYYSNVGIIIDYLDAGKDRTQLVSKSWFASEAVFQEFVQSLQLRIRNAT
jgi:hypothetical protein